MDVLDPDDWQRSALCAQTDPDLFFPDSHQPRRYAEATQWAKAVCVQCPVRLDCLEYALTLTERHGIWGGLSEDELHQLDRQAAR